MHLNPYVVVFSFKSSTIVLTFVIYRGVYILCFKRALPSMTMPSNAKSHLAATAVTALFDHIWPTVPVL